MQQGLRHHQVNIECQQPPSCAGSASNHFSTQLPHQDLRFNKGDVRYLEGRAVQSGPFPALRRSSSQSECAAVSYLDCCTSVIVNKIMRSANDGGEGAQALLPCTLPYTLLDQRMTGAVRKASSPLPRSGTCLGAVLTPVKVQGWL